jgi:aryl-alcohol dehydrogenase-like predicted oxidoreductase
MIGPASVSAIGLGCAGLSLDHADDPQRATLAIRAALDCGVTLFDTAIAYTTHRETHHNEHLLRRAASGPIADVPMFITTKGGHFRTGDTFEIDARPSILRAHCESSLQALGIERIDLYLLHWPDPQVPIEDSVAALGELQREGKIAQIGVSNVDTAQLERALHAAPIAAVENPLSIFDQQSRDVLDVCIDAGIAFLAYSPLGGAGRLTHRDLPAALNASARRHCVSPARIALAWLLAQSPNVIPIVGATRPGHVRDAVDATMTTLTPDDIRALTTPGVPTSP